MVTENKTSLITIDEVVKILKIQCLGKFGRLLAIGVLKLLRISQLNKIYQPHSKLSVQDFLNTALKEFHTKFHIPDKDLQKLPAKGPFIVIANHPLGGIDGIILLKLLLSMRPNSKIMANFILKRFAPLAPYIVSVNPFDAGKGSSENLAGLKACLKHVQAGEPLGIFPAGEVSAYFKKKLLIDKPWVLSSIKLIKNAKVPVIPIYFEARNSKLFYLLAKMHHALRTLKLPSEMVSPNAKNVGIRIGNIINTKDIDNFKEIKDLSDFLRHKVYVLAKSYDSKKIATEKKHKKQNELSIAKKAVEIIPSVDKSILEKELKEAKNKKNCLFQSSCYQVYLLDAQNIPNILQEIGRLREISFREVGEGTNKAYDLDEFDKWFHHLVLWDDENKALVGAYRLGVGKEIYKKYGKKGFYISTLFKIDTVIDDFLINSIEVGRSFIVKEYQQKPLPLFLLWRGIVLSLLKFPTHKYLVGGVSISNDFSDFSKALMIEFVKSNHWDPYLAQFVKPRKEFKVKLSDEDKKFILDATESDLKKFDKIIDDLEPSASKMPILLKKYIKQNAKLFAFNQDPLFNNTVDGLLYVKVHEMPYETLKPLFEELLKNPEQMPGDWVLNKNFDEHKEMNIKKKNLN